MGCGVWNSDRGVVVVGVLVSYEASRHNADTYKWSRSLWIWSAGVAAFAVGGGSHPQQTPLLGEGMDATRNIGGMDR